MSDLIYLNTVGCLLKVRIRDEDSHAPVNISTATSKKIVLLYPSGKVREFTASFTTDGSDGLIQYYTVSGDLNETGKYTISGRVVTPTFESTSQSGVFEVFGQR